LILYPKKRADYTREHVGEIFLNKRFKHPSQQVW